MKSRGGLAIAVALLPIVALGIAAKWWWWTRAQPRADVRPMIPEIKRVMLPTFHRPCRNAKECEWPLVCAMDTLVGGYRCLASECDTALQCEQGQVCRAVTGHAASVRLCMVTGKLKEGQRCFSYPRYATEGCESNLNCNLGYCGRHCRLDEPASCPSGTKCRDDANGASCVPACEDGSCPSGKECVHVSRDLAVCGVVTGQNCGKVLCPEGQECRHWRSYTGEERFVMWCEGRCAAGSACPAGEVCVDGW